MITKPTSLSPDGVTVAINEGIIKLSVQLQSGSDLEMIKDSRGNDTEYCYASLSLRANNKDYLFTYNDNTETIKGKVIVSDYATRVEFTLGSVISNKGSYSWKVKLFEKGSLGNESDSFNKGNSIGYGAIYDTSIIRVKDATDSEIEYICIKSSPFTNVYDAVVGTDSNEAIRLLNSKIRKTIKDNTKNFDENNRYYIVHNGKYYPVRYHRYFPVSNKFNKTTTSEVEPNFDEYGNVLYSYLYIDYDETVYQSFKDDDTIQIMSNYVESAQGFFKVNSNPVITFTDNRGNIIGDTTEDNPFILNYINLEIKGDYFQADGISLSYYNYKVYERRNDGRYDLKYTSYNKYTNKISCEFDKLMNHSCYKFVISITDGSGRTYDNEIYFKSEFDEIDVPIYAKAELYKEHNSVIIDWAESLSINPVITGGYKFISNGVISGAQLSSDTRLRYAFDDYGNPLNFKDSVIGLKFQALTNLDGCFMQFWCDDGFCGSVSCENAKIIVRTNKKAYEFSIYDAYTQDDVITALRSPNINLDVPYIADDTMDAYDTYYVHEESRLSQGIWTLIISKDNVYLYSSYLGRVFGGTAINKWSISTSYSALDISNNIIVSDMCVMNGSSAFEYLKNNENWTWNNDTVLLCNYQDTVNGANIKGSFRNVTGYRVYKTMGHDTTLYEVAHIPTTQFKVIEDYIVGDMCEYQWHVYPIIEKGDGLQMVGSAIKSNTITLHENVDKIMALKEIGERVYEVDVESVWRLWLNLKDGGFNMVNDKTFYDSLARYNQWNIGNKAYLTKNMSGLIGRIDCSTGGKYQDTYDMLRTWIDFTRSADMKCLIDLRGLVLPGDFEPNTSAEYIEAQDAPVSASFTWRQLADLDIIKIYATVLPYNPIYNKFLASSDHYSLSANPASTLYTET